MLRPVTGASEPTFLAHCHSNGRTNNGLISTKIQTIPWPHYGKGGYCIWGLYRYRLDLGLLDGNNTVLADQWFGMNLEVYYDILI